MEKLCDICPRNCNVDRSKNFGFCKCGNKIRVSKVMLHHYEEPIISGEFSENSNKFGSGAIFFSGCNLKCVYCQNFQISSKTCGKEISPEQLAEIFKKLEKSGALNINLVTPTHFTNQIIEALNIYRPALPIIWNTSGYEKAETIKLLDGYVDIFLTDLKYYSPELSKELSCAENYFETASKAIIQMRKNQPKDIIENNLMKKGIIIRHLVLPNQTKDSLKIIDFINDNLGNETYVSLMSQYVPMHLARKYEKINRKIKPLEYKILVNKLIKFNFKNVFLQDISSANCIFTPNFCEDESLFEL